MSAPQPPCRVCGCLDDVPGLCHALTPNGLACWRVKPDWCSACGTWDKSLRQTFPTAPIEALACQHRSQRADAAATKRGASVPGAFALRVHAARMRRKALVILAEAGCIDPVYKNPPPEKDLPLCPQSF